MGLPASLPLPHQHGSVEPGVTAAGPGCTAELDVDEQVREATGPLHTVSGGLALIATFHHFRLSARPN